LAHFSIKSFSSSVTRNCIICVFITPPMSIRVNDQLYVNMHDVSRSLRRATTGDVSVGPRVTETGVIALRAAGSCRSARWPHYEDP
jgi:hypothetical protein